MQIMKSLNLSLENTPVVYADSFSQGVCVCMWGHIGASTQYDVCVWK